MRNSAAASRTWSPDLRLAGNPRAKLPSKKWKLCGRTPRTMIEIRALHNHDEFVEAVRLQQTIWGFEDVELLPVRLFVTATKVGGQAFGAFDGGKMVGFCLAIPGIKAKGKAYIHSHMLGVMKG